MAHSTRPSGWIQPSFDDFLVSSSNGNKSTAKKNSGFSSTLPASSGKRKLSQRLPSTNNISKPSSIVSENPPFKKPTKAPKRRSLIAQPLGNRSLLDKYSPKCVADLALHPKKLKELKDRFERCNGLSCLLVSGPSGCGKLTALRIIAKECGFDISEWNDPLHWREWKTPWNSDRSNGHSELVRASQLDELSSFLLRSSCVSILDGAGGIFGESSRQSESSGRKLIIVKDLPNECHDKPDDFANMLRSFKRKVKKTVPVVVAFILSTSGGNGSNSRLFSTKLLEELHFDVFEFNAVANTILTRALR